MQSKAFVCFSNRKWTLLHCSLSQLVGLHSQTQDSYQTQFEYNALEQREKKITTRRNAMIVCWNFEQICKTTNPKQNKETNGFLSLSSQTHVCFIGEKQQLKPRLIPIKPKSFKLAIWARLHRDVRKQLLKQLERTGGRKKNGDSPTKTASLRYHWLPF